MAHMDAARMNRAHAGMSVVFLPGRLHVWCGRSVVFVGMARIGDCTIYI
jgi:hypothetical protein